MKIADIPEDEELRLKVLSDYEILDTLPEKDFDNLTMIASHICQTPIALVSLVDISRQWFKSHHGLDATETPRDYAFCAHAILQDGIFEIQDSSKDERFADNPLAKGEPHVRFYAGAPLKAHGKQIGTLCVIDHVPRKLNQDQKSALMALADQVVSQFELRKNNKEMEKILKAKSNFLANMSHEIRTPLNGLIGFANLLCDQKLSEEAKEYVDYIRSSSETLHQIINDILDLSKIESDKFSLDFNPTKLKPLIQSCVFLFLPLAKQKNIQLEVIFESNVPHNILIDPLRLRQIIMNLVGNAVKFTPNDKEVTVLVNTKENLLTVKVRDSGIGISKEKQKNLFHPFEQGDTSTTRKFGGSGLGLSICKELVSLLNGRIWVDSIEGKGSTFSFEIPYQVNEDIVSEQELLEHSICKLSELKILVVEDNLINQKFVIKLLNKLDQDCIDVAQNGKEAIDMALQKNYDLIFMDIQMPIMDGHQATSIIRNKISNDVKIVGLSANVFDSDKEKAKESGMDEYLEKPLKSKKLQEILEKLSK